MVWIVKQGDSNHRAIMPSVNGTANKTSLMDELKECLEGLVINVEIKITGLLEAKNTGEANNLEAKATLSVKKPEIAKPKEEPMVAMKSPSDSISKCAVDKPKAAPAEPKPQVPRNEPLARSELASKVTFKEPVAQLAKNEPLPEAPSKESKPSLTENRELPKKTIQEPPFKEPIVEKNPTPQIDSLEANAMAVEIQSGEPIRKKLGRPMKSSKVNKGSLKIGETITRSLIAADLNTTPATAYISYDDKKLVETVELITKHSDNIEGQAALSTASEGDIVLAKSADDDQWYRAIVESNEGNSIRVFFFDWGLYEELPCSRLKHMQNPQLGLSKIPACALKIELTASNEELINDILTMEESFNMKVVSYNELTETYKMLVLGRNH